MKDDELLATLSPEAIAILQAAITPRIDTADITLSSIDGGVIVTTTAAGVYRQLGSPWSAALTELWEHALVTNREERGGRELPKISYTLLGMVKFDLTEEGSTNTLVALSAAQLPFAIALTINPQARPRAVAAETEQLAPRFFLFLT